MSEAVTALGGVKFAGIAEVREAPLQGMITLRGRLDDSAFAEAVAAATGMAVPAVGETLSSEARRLCWMSPDELLFLCAYAEVPAQMAKVTAALQGQHALAVNVSDARAVMELGGAHARDVLAKLCPVNLSVDAFGPGQFRRTRLAQVPAAFWMPAEDQFRIVCFCSQAQYVFDVLSIAAQAGSEVNHLLASG